MSDVVEVPEQTEKEEITQSWISRCIEPCPNSGVSSAFSCPFGNKGVHQHAFTTRIVQRSDDPKTLLPIVKGILFGKLEPIFFDPTIDPNIDACFNCWKIRKHTYKRCREPKNYKFCLNCGRRNVEIYDCPRCAKGNEEYEKQRGKQIQAMPPEVEYRFKRNKSRRRSNVRRRPLKGEDVPIIRDKSRVRSDDSRFDSQHSSRSRVRGLSQSSNLRDQSKGPPRDMQFDSQDSSRGRSRNNVTFDSRNPRDKSRGRMRNELYDSRNMRDKSRPREKNVTWLDSQDFCGKKYNERENNREEGNSIQNTNRYQDNTSASKGEIFNNKGEKLESNIESGNNITRQYLDLMDSIKHLPAETQNEMVKLFLKEREALINQGGVKLE